VRTYTSVSALTLVLLAAACTPPPPPKPPPPRQDNVAVVVEPPIEESLRLGHEELLRRNLPAARARLRRALIAQPDHLEGRVLQAMILEAAGDPAEAAKSWTQVERILVYHGKLVPFELQPVLHGAAVHYFKAGRLERARIFLDELWRRFPAGEWSAKTQLALAESEFGRGRHTQAIEACGELTRLRPGHVTLGRCKDLTRAARRMLEVGPEPAPSAARWVWEHPLPQGNALNDLWVSPAGTAYAVGDAGTILVRRGSGGAFSLQLSPTRWALHRVWGTADDNIYAVGAAGVVLHFDGSEWRVARKPSPERGDLWGVYTAGPGHAVAVGEDGVALELRQGKWTERRIASVPLRAAWGTSADDVFASGDGGALLRQRGGRWAMLASDCYEDLWSVWGAGEGHVLAVGNRRTVVHFDGVKAKETIAGHNSFRDVWGFGTKQAWAVGTGGDIVSYTGKGWRSETSGILVDLNGVAGNKPSELWAVGAGGTILTLRGNRWSVQSGGVAQGLVAVASGPTAGAGLALGEAGVLLRRKAGHWRVEAPLPGGRYRDLWTDGSRAVVVGERGLLVVRKNKGWQRVATDTPEDLVSVWGWDGGAVAVGTRGTVVRLVGDKVTREETGTGLDLRGVWGTSSRALYAVGNRGVVLRFDGERWSEQESGTLADLHAVWGTSPQSAFAVGSGGAILALERGRWRAMSSPVSQSLVDLWGSSADRIFAVSDKGGVVQYDGTAWRVQRSPTSCLTAVHGDPATGVLAVGCHGTILRWQP